MELGIRLPSQGPRTSSLDAIKMTTTTTMTAIIFQWMKSKPQGQTTEIKNNGAYGICATRIKNRKRGSRTRAQQNAQREESRRNLENKTRWKYIEDQDQGATNAQPGEQDSMKVHRRSRTRRDICATGNKNLGNKI